MLNRVGMYYGPGDIRLVDQPLTDLAATDLVIQVSACGICGSDLHFYRAGGPPPQSVLGHEFSGTVYSMGSQLRGFVIGERVTANPMLLEMGYGSNPGAFARYVHIRNAVAGKNVFKLPDTVSDEAAALIEPFSVALHAVNLIRKNPDDKVAVFGAGPIGLSALCAMKAAGVKEIVVTDVSPLRLEMALKLGASAVFNPRDGNVVDYLAKRHGGGFNPLLQSVVPDTDTIIECAGVPQAFLDAVNGVRFGGQVMVVAAYEAPVTLQANVITLKELKVLGSFWAPNEFAEAIELMASGKVELTPMITHRFELEDISRAFETQARGDKAIKVMVRPAN